MAPLVLPVSPGNDLAAPAPQVGVLGTAELDPLVAARIATFTKEPPPELERASCFVAVRIRGCFLVELPDDLMGRGASCE